MVSSNYRLLLAKIIVIFTGLIDDLISAVAKRSQYFIQGVNLLENISDDLLKAIGDKLANLRRYPVELTHAHNPERTDLTALEQYGFRQFSSCGKLKLVQTEKLITSWSKVETIFALKRREELKR